MRVTHVITRLIVGGAQENTLASVLGLRRKPGTEATLLSGLTSGPEGSLEHLCAGQPDLFSVLPQLVRPVHPWKDLLTLRKLRHIFRSSHPDIVHTHSGKAGVLGRLAAAQAGVPLIVHTIHGPSFGAFQGELANRLFKLAERRAGAVTNHFVVVAEAMKQQYLAAGIGRPDQYTKIFSGFDLQPFLSATNDPEQRAQLGIASTDFVVGQIARLFKLKGHADLFAAAPALLHSFPQFKFLLVGDGPWRGRFERQVRLLGLQDRFVFTGLVPPERVARLVGIMDVLIHLSLREGLARALPQAMAAGRPIITYDCDGSPEVCFENRTGFLLRPGDISGLHRRLQELATNSELRERLGGAGREFVRERFRVEQMVDHLYELYGRLMSAKAGTLVNDKPKSLAS